MAGDLFDSIHSTMSNQETEQPDEVNPPDELAWLRPPRNPQDGAAWDRYWQEQVKHGYASFNDMFLDDESLVRRMVSLGAQTVLCAGNGLSVEPYVLSYAGFRVTAADLSAWATELRQTRRLPSKFLKRHLYGSFGRPVFYGSLLNRVRTLAGIISRANKGIWNPLGRKGGTVQFLAGNLLEPEFCKGPFDAVIERCTAQLYSVTEHNPMLEALAARLSPKGLFFSQCHMGWWRPGEPRTHPCEQWFREHGFTIVNMGLNQAAVSKDSGRSAILMVTTG